MIHTKNDVMTHLLSMDIKGAKLYHNLTPSDYEKHILKAPDAVRSSFGAVSIRTGKFTGRSPQNRYIVDDDFSHSVVDWGDVNQAISSETFDSLKSKLCAFLDGQEIFVHDAFVCADDSYKMNVRTVCQKAYSALFASNMFRNFSAEELPDFTVDWTVICVPDFKANPSDYSDLKNENFAILNFTNKEIIIGGTGYTGEIKKGIFSALNCLLPLNNDVLAMHCSANVDKAEKSAIFFGLSGTGKTTLSADPNRLLIGDDEHGWGKNGVFNFEGGCYAKTINLSQDGEPQIYAAIKQGALLENIGFVGDTNVVDFRDNSITENTRVSYPLDHIAEAKPDSKAGHPENIFFLTCDAFGVLPPISKLTKEQAMYYFISGYTAKIAGTEEGITEPQATFSAGFGAPFLPLHPGKYAEMLGKKMDEHDVNIWLVNTGWTEGAYGEGHRISLKITRALISAALNNELENEEFEIIDGFDLAIPKACNHVPSNVLNPRNTWKNRNAYDEKASHLIHLFQSNFKQYESGVSSAIKDASPKLLVS